MNKLKLNDTIEFGQFKGKTVKKIIDMNPFYMDFIVYDQKIVKIDHNAMIYLIQTRTKRLNKYVKSKTIA